VEKGGQFLIGRDVLRTDQARECLQLEGETMKNMFCDPHLVPEAARMAIKQLIQPHLPCEEGRMHGYNIFGCKAKGRGGECNKGAYQGCD
jgi:hypothetical protein